MSFQWLLILLLSLPALRATAEVTAKSTNDVEQTFGPPEWVVRIADSQGRQIGEPTVILYADGHLLSRRGTAGEFECVRLTPAEQRKLLAGLPSGKFDRLPRSVWVDFGRDDGGNTIIVHFSGPEKHSVLVSDDLSVPRSGRRKIPRAFLAAFHTLWKFHSARATRWVPPEVEILVGAIYARDQRTVPLKWPSNWPKPTWGKPLFIDRSMIPQFEKYAATVDRSRWRLILEAHPPHEEMWTR